VFNFSIHNNLNAKDNRVIQVVAIVICEAVFINETVSAPAVDLALSFIALRTVIINIQQWLACS
jgi:hypothetical protein